MKSPSLKRQANTEKKEQMIIEGEEEEGEREGDWTCI